MSERQAVTKADIVAGLRALGLADGDTVLVHTSVRSFGPLEGGADAIIDGLLQTVGARGCVVVPTLTLGTGEAPVVYEVRSSPSTSGVLTDVFRQRPEARRSLHPTSSAAAIGFAAEEMTRHHGDTPCGLTSPYGQVYLRGGYCLFLGAPWTSNTMFHVAEEIVDLPYLRMAEFRDATLVDEEGVARTAAFRRYNCYQSGVKRDLAAMERFYVEAGAVRERQIGESVCRLIRARDVIDISIRVLREQLDEIVSYG